MCLLLALLPFLTLTDQPFQTAAVVHGVFAESALTRFRLWGPSQVILEQIIEQEQFF